MTPESTASDLKCTVPECSKAYKRKAGLTNHMASVHQMLVTNVFSPMTETARTLFGKQVVPGTPGVQGNSRGQVTSPLLVAEATFMCGICEEEFNNEEEMNNHRTETHDEAYIANENDDARSEVLAEEEDFLGDDDDEQDLYDSLDFLTQGMLEPEKESEIKDKLVRYRNIMINKTKLQVKTREELEAAKEETKMSKEVETKQFKELEKKGKDIEKLSKEVRQLKKQNSDLKEDNKQKEAVIIQLKEAVAKENEIEVIEQRVNLDKEISGHNCNACNKEFRTSHDLDRHIEGKHTECTCTYCGKKFNNERELTKHHKRCVDEGLRTSKCQNCKKIFNSFAMKRHKETCHEQEMFDCPECGQMCETAIDVKRHYDDEHKMEQVRYKEVCKHWRRGHCNKGDQCLYAHVGQQQSSDSRSTKEKSMRVPACKHGSNCDWLKRGVCSYFHRGVGVQKPWNNRGLTQAEGERQPNRNQTNPGRQSERLNNHSEGRNERFPHSEGRGERYNRGSGGAGERSHDCPCINSLQDFPTFRGQRQDSQQRQNQGRRRN